MLVNLGGIGHGVDPARWPVSTGWHWIVPRGMGAGRTDGHALDALEAQGFCFIDLLCSANAFVTKPGYGGVTEAGCNGVPVLYVPRGDWPEEPGLIAWLSAAVPAAGIGREELAAGAPVRPLEALLECTRPDPPAPDGIEQAVTAIASRLGFWEEILRAQALRGITSNRLRRHAPTATIAAMVHSLDSYPFPASAETVWRFFASYNELPRITGVYVKSVIEDGGRRRLSEAGGGELVEQLLLFDEANRTFRYRIVELVDTEMSYVTGSYVGTVRILDDQPGVSCICEFGGDYQAKPGCEDAARRETPEFYETCLAGIRRELGLPEEA